MTTTQKTYEHERNLLVNKLAFHANQIDYHTASAKALERQLEEFDEINSDRYDLLEEKRQREWQEHTDAAMVARKLDKPETEVQERIEQAKAKAAYEHLMKGFQPE